MSADDEVTDALQTPLDNNAQSAEDVKKMLAELKGESGPVNPKDAEKPEKANGTAEKEGDNVKKESSEVKAEDDKKPRGNQEREEVDTHRNHDRRERERDGRSHRGGRGGRGRGEFKSRQHTRDNIKSNLIKEETSSDPEAIRKQVEFYFSDSNLPMDKFLLNKVGGSKNNPVEISILHSFKRMRHFQPFEAIVSALKDSTILELTDDDTCVRRKEPLPEALNDGPDENAVRIFEDRAMPRSIYAKGFGEEIPSTQFDVEAFFAPYGPTNAIRLRRANDQTFKGSVFVEFATEDLQKAFLELDPKPHFKGKDLQVMSKKQYCDQKVEDIKSGKIKANAQHDKSGGRGSWNDHRDRDHKRKRDDNDDRDWRTRRDEDRKNGFRDERKRGDRDRDSRGRGFGAGRGGRYEKVEKDERGVPTVKETSSHEARRKGETADAIAKARAAVEADRGENKQDAADAVETADREGKDVNAGTVDTVKENIKAEIEATPSKKREREAEEEDQQAKKGKHEGQS